MRYENKMNSAQLFKFLFLLCIVNVIAITNPVSIRMYVIGQYQSMLQIMPAYPIQHQGQITTYKVNIQSNVEFANKGQRGFLTRPSTILISVDIN